MSRNGLLLIISGPSGSGKGTIVQELQKQCDLFVSISATTRAPRPGEVDGRSYYFLTREEFQQRLQAGGILEYNEYCGNYYGTPKKELEEQLRMGRDAVLEIDVNGASQVMKSYPTVSLFVLPPSWEVLEQRLRKRGSEDDATIRSRLQEAKRELQHAGAYDYLILNGELQDAVDQVRAVILAEKCKMKANLEFVKGVFEDE